MEYEYPNKSDEPNLATTNESGELISGIHFDVANSVMTDKTIESCTWRHADETLHIVFTNELSGSDKAILDQIVEDNS